jgi:hypothetical protein
MTQITFDEQTFEIPEAEDWPVDALLAYEDGKVGSLVRALLGADGWARFSAKPRTLRDLTALMAEVEKGLDSGN